MTDPRTLSAASARVLLAVPAADAKPARMDDPAPALDMAMIEYLVRGGFASFRLLASGDTEDYWVGQVAAVPVAQAPRLPAPLALVDERVRAPFDHPPERMPLAALVRYAGEDVIDAVHAATLVDLEERGLVESVEKRVLFQKRPHHRRTPAGDVLAADLERRLAAVGPAVERREEDWRAFVDAIGAAGPASLGEDRVTWGIAEVAARHGVDALPDADWLATAWLSELLDLVPLDPDDYYPHYTTSDFTAALERRDYAFARGEWISVFLGNDIGYVGQRITHKPKRQYGDAERVQAVNAISSGMR